MPSLFVLLGRVMLALLLVAHPMLRPVMADAAPANECCGSPAEPMPHACCCDVAAALPSGPALLALCCDAGDLPPFLPGPATLYKQAFERTDVATAFWAPAPPWPLNPKLHQSSFPCGTVSPARSGPRRHLRVHVLLI